ncbi:recombinase, partial [Streptomyces sp. SID5770]|nr:recombinase [Streptomyces sp. SID5770]
MPEHVIPGRTGGLITLSAADALWSALTAGSGVPTAAAVFTCSPADARAGYVLLGHHVVETVQTSAGQWSVAETEMRRAAATFHAVNMDRQDLVRIDPFHTALQQHSQDASLRWRQRIARELQEPGGPDQTAQGEDDRLRHLVGIDWRRIFVARTRDQAMRTWWLPRAAVRLLDAAEHTERQWRHTA